MTRERTTPVADALGGGDRRSVGGVRRVVARVLRDRALVAELVAALRSARPVVAMRAADALEKLSRTRAEWLAPHRARLVRAAVETADPAVRWNLLQLLARLPHGPRSVLTLARRLEVWFVTDRSAIVRTAALDALVTLAAGEPRLGPRARRLLAEARTAPSAAVRARARRLTRTIAAAARGDGPE